MAASLYQVIPLELNLRSAPRVEPGTVLARLRQGQQVVAVSVTPAPPAGWLRVRADLQGTAVEGVVKAAYLKAVQSPAPLPAPPATLPNIPEARLPSSGPIRRNQNGDGPRVYDLTYWVSLRRLRRLPPSGPASRKDASTYSETTPQKRAGPKIKEWFIAERVAERGSLPTSKPQRYFGNR